CLGCALPYCPTSPARCAPLHEGKTAFVTQGRDSLLPARSHRTDCWPRARERGTRYRGPQAAKNRPEGRFLAGDVLVDHPEVGGSATEELALIERRAPDPRRHVGTVA